jgi:predicted amidohydrolase
MKIAAAQIRPLANNTTANIEKHLQMIDLAITQKVQLILFPELSLTGYEREMAGAMAFTENDPRLDALKEKAKTNGITIIVGAPIMLTEKLHIGAFVLLPNGKTEIYTKQFLHDGEEIYFSPSNNYNPLITFDGEQISMAICADLSHPAHAAQAAAKNTTLYLASIFYTPNGLPEAYQNLSSYAAKYGMKVLMANFTGTSYGMEAAGQSAFWNAKGQLKAKLTAKEEELLIIAL